VELWGVDSDLTAGILRRGQQKRMRKGAVRYQGFWATAKAAMCKVLGSGQLCKYENVMVFVGNYKLPS
jgi:hypothetical protein